MTTNVVTEPASQQKEETKKQIWEGKPESAQEVETRSEDEQVAEGSPS